MSLSFSHLSSAVMPGACHSLTCPVPSCQEPVILPPVQCRHASSLSFSHCPVPSCQEPVILPPVQCRHASSLSFSHLSSAVMPEVVISEVEFRSADVTDNLEETAWTTQMDPCHRGERGLFVFVFFSKLCTRSLCRLLCFHSPSGCTLDRKKGSMWMSRLCDMEIVLSDPWDLTVATSGPWDLPLT